MVIRMIGNDLKDAVVQLKRQDQVVDGKGSGNSLGDDTHIQFQRIEFLERNFETMADGPHDHLFGQRYFWVAPDLQVEGNNDVDQIRQLFFLLTLVVLATAS